MRTVVINIKPEENGRFPVHLCTDDGSDSGDGNPTSFILKGLTLDNPVKDPFSKTGAPLDAQSVKRFFSEDTEGHPERFKAIGKYLYQLLFQGETKKRWDELRTQYPGESQFTEGLRTILDIEPLELRALPWELMAEDDLSRLFMNTSQPFARGRIDFSKDVRLHMWPLRALIIVGSARKDNVIDAELEVESIVGALRDISRTIEVDIMRRRSKSELVEKYKELEPHIIHFIGHGGKTGDTSYLSLYDDKDDWERWTVEEIGVGLGGPYGTHWAASFAFINACRSGDNIGLEGTWAIADAFISARIPAVLSMLGDIKEEAAQMFACRVYEAMAENKSLDRAVAEARHGMSNCKEIGLRTKQWALASLFLSAPPDKVLAIDHKIGETMRTQIKEDKEFGQLQAFVDRLDQRLKVSKGVDPRAVDSAGKNLLVVRGSERVGKTSMVKLCLECCAMRGRRVSWVNAGGGKGSKTFLQVLRFIRDGDSTLNSLLSRSLDDQGAFSQFNWELKYLLKSKFAPDSLMPPGQIKEDQKSLKKAWKGGADHRARLFFNFTEALKRVASDVPLIIVLDNMEIEPDDFNEVLIPYLILPIKRGEVTNVKLILVLSQKNEREYELDKRLGHYEDIMVPRFKKEDFVPFTLEFLRYNRNLVVPPRDKVKHIVEALGESIIGEYWDVTYLKTVLGVFKI